MILHKTSASLLFFLLLSYSSFAQSLSNKSVTELDTMKKDAISNENFELASKIKRELKSRVTIDEKITEKNKLLEVAVANEDYDKAEQLKKEIEKLKANKIKIEKLKEEKKKSIALEDYDRVIAIEKEIKVLKSLKQPSDRPLNIEQEIDFVIRYFQNKIDELNGSVKAPDYFKYLKEEQKQSMITSYQKGKTAYEGYKGRETDLSKEEENGIFIAFLTFLKLSKEEQIKDLYRQYYLKKATKHTPFTLREKIKGQISYYENTIKAFPEETPQSSFDTFDKLIRQNEDYLYRINSLSKIEVGVINNLFNTIPLTEKSVELSSERIINYFKPIPGLN